MPWVPLLEILQHHEQGSILIPFLNSARRSLLRRRSRGRRGKGIHLLSGCQSCLAGPEVVKIFLCDSSPVLNGVAICLAEVGKDLAWLQHALVADRKWFSVPSSSGLTRTSLSGRLRARRSTISSISPWVRTLASSPSFSYFRTTVTTCSSITLPSGGGVAPLWVVIMVPTDN